MENIHGLRRSEIESVITTQNNRWLAYAFASDTLFCVVDKISYKWNFES